MDYEEQETCSVLGASSMPHDSYRLSCRASLRIPSRHGIHGHRLGTVSRVRTCITDGGLLEMHVCSYLLLCCFGMGQTLLEGREESIVGGSLLAFFLMFGMCMGSLAALGWVLFD